MSEKHNYSISDQREALLCRWILEICNLTKKAANKITYNKWMKDTKKQREEGVISETHSDILYTAIVIVQNAGIDIIARLIQEHNWKHIEDKLRNVYTKVWGKHLLYLKARLCNQNQYVLWNSPKGEKRMVELIVDIKLGISQFWIGSMEKQDKNQKELDFFFIKDKDTGPRNMTAIGLKCKPSTGLTQYHSVTYEKLSNKNMAIYYKKTLRMNSILAIDKNDIYRHGIILRQLLDKTLYTKSRVENNEYLKMIYTEIIICGKIPVCFANCGKIEFFDLSEYFNFDEALVDTQYNCENHMDSLQYTANENDTSEEEDDQMYHGNFETQEELIKSKQTKKSPIT